MVSLRFFSSTLTPFSGVCLNIQMGHKSDGVLHHLANFEILLVNQRQITHIVPYSLEKGKRLKVMPRHVLSYQGK